MDSKCFEGTYFQTIPLCYRMHVFICDNVSKKINRRAILFGLIWNGFVNFSLFSKLSKKKIAQHGGFLSIHSYEAVRHKIDSSLKWRWGMNILQVIL